MKESRKVNKNNNQGSKMMVHIKVYRHKVRIKGISLNKIFYNFYFDWEYRKTLD